MRMRDPIWLRHNDIKTSIIIYALRDPRTKLIHYVGQTINLERRYNQHLRYSETTGTFSMADWFQSLRESGNHPEVAELEVCECATDANEREKFWIKKLIQENHPILNHASGGRSTRSSKNVDRTRFEDWIELGYYIKYSYETTLRTMELASKMLGKTSSPCRKIKTIINKMDNLKNDLDEIVCRERPQWNEATRVVYGLSNEHISCMTTNKKGHSISDGVANE